MNRAKARRENKSNKWGIFSVSVIVFAICAVLIVQMQELKAQDNELAVKEEKLSEQLKEEEERTATLEERRIYVQTKMYVEEVAKRLGYVYPDEIIFKPAED